jgi:hypothetical protein
MADGQGKEREEGVGGEILVPILSDSQKVGRVPSIPHQSQVAARSA